ncbi:uncharacterized protein LOC117113203 [Anneissia japonica]|uniref:uncharacterized protein LOC117113203 n=1 Tax=Anneissia japonica TaxID=1529436 RepID=UPI00142595D9|nr:uncharacterized protein LOC117113203 [Anneissia japonica]
MSFLFVTIMGLALSNSLASHYRGGTIKWAVSPTNPNKVLLSWRVSWRRSYAPASGFRCERPGQELTGEGYLLCEQCSSKIITDMAFNCTDFSDAGEATKEDWATGVGRYEYSFESNIFDITFRFDDQMQTYGGSNWIQLQNYGQANFYKMVSSVDLTVRPDTGRPNSSPATTMLPIIRVQSGCSSKIRIPTLDADDDVVRCRWSEYSKDECPPYNLYGKSVCGPITTDTLLDENRCEITFSSAGKAPGWYGVAVMIEDFSDKESTLPLSKIPLQFLIYVYPLELPCRKIQISSPLCEVIAPNQHFSARIEAFSESEGVRSVLSLVHEYYSSLDAPTEPSVVCDPGQMSVYIPKVYVDDMPARKFMLHDPSCRGRDFNETHFVVQTRYDECGSVLKKKDGKLVVRNTVRDKIRPITVSNGAAVSRRKHKFEIVATCKSEVSYNADIKLNPDSVQSPPFGVHGMFDVAASMALFANDAYDDRYDSGEDEIDIRMNQRLYVSVMANQEDVSLKVEQCKAHAVDNQGNMSDGEFIFLDNGCPNDETLRFENSPAPNEKRFSLEAFTFMYTGIKDNITIRCSVSICEGEEDDECGDQCSTGEAVEDSTGDSIRGRRSNPRLTDVYLTV